MILVDQDIKKLLKNNKIIISSIEPDMPFSLEKQLEAGSIELRLSNRIRKYKSSVEVIDLSLTGDTVLESIEPGNEFTIMPGEIILATTLELVILPANIAALVTGRSSIARLGLMVQCSQDYLQPGHSQLVPLQLVNVTNKPIKLMPYIPICKIALLLTNSAAEVPYPLRSDARYLSEISNPQPSQIGVELGSDDPNELNDGFVEQDAQVMSRISQLRKQVVSSPIQNPNPGKNRQLLSYAILVIIGASVGLMMQEIVVQPFPSSKLIVSGTFFIFSVVILGLLPVE